MTEFEQKQLEQLTRIANFMANIDMTLDNINDAMNTLGSVVGYVPAQDRGYVRTGGYSFLRIGGSVDTETY